MACLKECVSGCVVGKGEKSDVDGLQIELPLILFYVIS